MVAIQTTDYIMDVVSSMERQGIKFSLCFRRVLWLQGLRLDNELLVNVVYFQVNLVKLVFITGRPLYSYGLKSEHQLSIVHIQRKCRWTLRRFQFAPEYTWMKMLRCKSKWNVNLVAPVSYYFAVVEEVNFRITEFQQISLKPDIHWIEGFSK